MKRDEWDQDELVYWLMEIERRQKLLAIMLTVFALLWAFSKLFPIVVVPFFN